MNRSHTLRRKTIKKFKKKFGAKWYPEFRKHVDEIKRKMDGPLIGTLEDIVGLQ